MLYCNNKKRDDTCQHTISNGRFFCGLRGHDIYRFVGPSVGGRNMFSAYFANEETVETWDEKERGKNVWKYLVKVDGKDAGVFYDYVTTENCFVRAFDLTSPLLMKLVLDEKVSRLADGTFYLPAGVEYVNWYKTDVPVYFRVFGEGIAVSEDGTEITMNGKGKLVIKTENTHAEARCDFVGDVVNFVPERGVIPELEDTFYLEANMQARSGAIFGAVEWNMAYIRDTYGVSRGFLAMGEFARAKAILDFYSVRFSQRGSLATAQPIGETGYYHVHECDETENTGYLMLQIFDYYRATGDEESFKRYQPMLNWAFYAQLNILKDGMMPFCGDETYLACSMLPKAHIDDGSAEATMLFLEAARRYAPYFDDEEAKKVVAEAREKYRANFVRDGKLITNNPARRKKEYLPETRLGCCMGCGYHRELHLNEFDTYVCDACKDRGIDTRSDKIYELTCVSMMPTYIGSDLFTKEELLPIMEGYARYYIEHKSLFGGARNRITGYELGLLLNALVEFDSELAHDIYKEALAALDDENVWAEYYEEGKPVGMRWRTWESGVNAMAVLKYREKFGK